MNLWETDAWEGSYELVTIVTFIPFLKPIVSSWHFLIFLLLEWKIMYCRHTGMSSNEFEWASQFIFPCFIYFFRVWGVNWIDSGDACTSQEQNRDLLFWLSSCYGAVHYWFYFSSLLLSLTFTFTSYLLLLSRSLFPSCFSLLALIEKQQVVMCNILQFHSYPKRPVLF